jgi:hypothetical protein
MSNSLSKLINSDTTPTSKNILSLETLKQQYNNALLNYQQAYQSLVTTLQTDEQQINTYKTNNDQPSYIGCYNDTGTTAYRAMSQLNTNGTLSTTNGNDYDVNYDEAYQYAQDNNYQYFSTQDCNSDGGCQAGFSNDLAQSTQYGVATNCVNGNGGVWTNAIYSTKKNSIQNAKNKTNYIGCYTDCADGRAMSPIDVSGNTSAGWNIAWDYNSCQQAAQEQGYQYFGLQYFNQPGEATGLGQCTVSNDLTTATAQGPATNCGAADASGNVLGNYCSNAIYSTSNQSGASITGANISGANISGTKSAIENVKYWGNEVIHINRQIMELLKKESPYFQGEINKRQSINTKLKTDLQELLQEREKVNDYINKYNSFDQGIEETSIETKQKYFQYILYVILLIIVIIFFFKIILFTKPQSGGGSGSNSTKMKDILFLIGLMLVFLFSGYFFKQHAGFILILLVVVIFVLSQMKLIPNILRF